MEQRGGLSSAALRAVPQAGELLPAQAVGQRGDLISSPVGQSRVAAGMRAPRRAGRGTPRSSLDPVIGGHVLARSRPRTLRHAARRCGDPTPEAGQSSDVRVPSSPASQRHDRVARSPRPSLCWPPCYPPRPQPPPRQSPPLFNTPSNRPAWGRLPAGFKSVGDPPSWAGSVNAVQYSKLTHINYAFVLLNYNGSLRAWRTPQALSPVARGHANRVKVSISIGGRNDGNDSAFEALAANAGGPERPSSTTS